MPLSSSRRGYSLVEIIVTIGIFVILSVGIYSTTVFVFRAVHQSRVRIIETALLSEQVEIIRNLAYSDVGIILGSPAGVLYRNTTTTRNGLDFLITRTIRSIDNPFDGTIGGAPNDTAPADYKLVEIEATCLTCKQQSTVAIETYVGPRTLEGDPNHGALFIEVFDANGEPVSGADVHVVATSTTTTYDFIDTTDDDGMLRIVDLSSGQRAYHLTVSKSGYTTDQTHAPTPAMPTPLKPPASVVPQEVTEISLSIDRVSAFNLQTMNASCDPISTVTTQVFGTRLIADEPTDVLLFNETQVTSGSGALLFSSVPWDTYTFVPSGYTLIGAIPQLPFSLLPASTQPVSLVLGPLVVRSLLVSVRDSTTHQPIPEATVTISQGGFINTQTTGVGFVHQTDWSGGSSQQIFTDVTQYAADDGFIDTTTSTGNVILRDVGGVYVSNGELESSTFDLGLSPTYGNLLWEPVTQPVDAGSTSLRFQFASGPTATSTFIFTGPDGTPGTYYVPGETVIHESHDGNRFMRYKAFFSTNSVSSTPILSDVLATYTNSCTPPGQVYLSNPPAGVLDISVSKTGYQTITSTVSVSGNESLTLDIPLAN